MRVDGTTHGLETPPKLDRRKKHEVDVVVDRIAVRQKSRGRIAEAVELALSLIAWRDGLVPATLNHQTPDPACPINVSGDHREVDGDTVLSVNYALTGQAVAAVVASERT
ncbi:MAG: hypothetical protein AAFZ07_29750 [Actinomycetota bacterium]